MNFNPPEKIAVYSVTGHQRRIIFNLLKRNYLRIMGPSIFDVKLIIRTHTVHEYTRYCFYY